MEATQLTGGCHDDGSNDITSAIQRIAPLDEPSWQYDAEDLEVTQKLAIYNFKSLDKVSKFSHFQMKLGACLH